MPATCFSEWEDGSVRGAMMPGGQVFDSQVGEMERGMSWGFGLMKEWCGKGYVDGDFAVEGTYVSMVCFNLRCFVFFLIFGFQYGWLPLRLIGAGFFVFLCYAIFEAPLILEYCLTLRLASPTPVFFSIPFLKIAH